MKTNKERFNESISLPTIVVGGVVLAIAAWIILVVTFSI